MTPDRDVRHLPGWEGEVSLWLEQDSSIMVRASTQPHGDPVELTATDARRLARLLNDAADRLEAADR